MLEMDWKQFTEICDFEFPQMSDAAATSHCSQDSEGGMNGYHLLSITTIVQLSLIHI